MAVTDMMVGGQVGGQLKDACVAMLNDPFSGSASAWARAVEAGALAAEGAALLGDVGVFTPPPLHPAASTHTNRQNRFIGDLLGFSEPCVGAPSFTKDARRATP
jgi:hypothetical protein